MLRHVAFVLLSLLALTNSSRVCMADDHIRQLQTAATDQGRCSAAHWGTNPADYIQWKSHSNRLIPVYTYGTRGASEGVDLNSYIGDRSVYRSAERLAKLYGEVPTHTLNEKANYFDQTNLYDLQKAAAKAGKRHIFVVVFDGMDWDTTRAAAIHNSQAITYTEGRGTGTHFQNYTAGGTTQFGYMVTSPHNEGTDVNVDTQQVINAGGVIRGGYCAELGGSTPWEQPKSSEYLIGLPENAAVRHAYTDSAPSASSITAGMKSYNNAIAVDHLGRQATTIAHELQSQGWVVGVVSSVPFSHATPAAAYAHNVSRHDFQDISRDLLGLPSVSHSQPLPGMDIVLGAGWGVHEQSDPGQGSNFLPGSQYIADTDLAAADVKNGGRYVVAQRTPGTNGGDEIQAAAKQAAQQGKRLLGFYGTPEGNLPFQTADGDYQPAPSRDHVALKYTTADLVENPTLAEMTFAAITVAQQSKQGFWLMIEAGDVDWANHADNLDNSIGAVNSGDAAFRVIVQWVEQHSNWDDSLVIVTADHGHMLTLDRPELLIAPKE